VRVSFILLFSSSDCSFFFAFEDYSSRNCILKIHDQSNFFLPVLGARFLGNMFSSFFFAPFHFFLFSGFRFISFPFFSFCFDSDWVERLTFKRVGAVLSCEGLVLLSFSDYYNYYNNNSNNNDNYSISCKVLGAGQNVAFQANFSFSLFNSFWLKNCSFILFYFVVNHILLWPILEWLVNSVFSVLSFSRP